MSVSENRSAIRRTFEAINREDLDSFGDLCSSNYQVHFPGVSAALPSDGAKELFRGFFSAFPGISHTIEELVAEDDRAACQLTIRGVHRGDLQGIPPTGRQVSVPAINVFRLQGGKILEQWISYDALGMMRQLGVIPPDGLAEAPVESRSSDTTRTEERSLGSPEANKAVVRRFYDEVCNARRLDLADELFDPAHVYHDPSVPGVPRGPEGIKQAVATYQNATDGRWTVDDLVAEGDTVVARWTGRGTHVGDLNGIPPTGRSITVPGMWVFHFANGRIVESWDVWDTLGMLQQLGVIPAQTARQAA